MSALFDLESAKSIEICKKGTNCEVLNLNNWRLGRLKVHVTLQKNSCTDVGNPTKKFIFE